MSYENAVVKRAHIFVSKMPKSMDDYATLLAHNAFMKYANNHSVAGYMRDNFENRYG